MYFFINIGAHPVKNLYILFAFYAHCPFSLNPYSEKKYYAIVIKKVRLEIKRKTGYLFKIDFVPLNLNALHGSMQSCSIENMKLSLIIRFILT